VRLISCQRLGIIASVVWVAVGPTHFHLSQENHARQIAGDRYQLCIKQNWARKEGVEGCNTEFGQALAIAHWSSWGQLAFIPVGLAWFIGWGVFCLARRVRGKPQSDSEHYPQIGNGEDNDKQRGKEDDFPAPWTVEVIDGGFKVVDANKQAIAYVYGRETKADADIAKVLTMDEARRIASNIAKLPKLLGKGG